MAMAKSANNTRTLNVLSLFDATGEWVRPYYEAGHNCMAIDIQSSGEYSEYRVGQDDSIDVSDINIEWFFDQPEMSEYYSRIDVLLAAPMCTHFCSSGAQYWPQKDSDGRTEEHLELVYQTLRTVEFLKPSVWCIENPVGRLNKLIPELADVGPWYIQPHHYGDPYTKKTGLWGRFSRDLPRNDVEPIRACDAGSWLMQLGGSSDKTKKLRSTTPQGFARAFFEANHRLPETNSIESPEFREACGATDDEEIEWNDYYDMWTVDAANNLPCALD
tara:strand:+ start:284 stop:1105 length:822 start_codon:yes stop_codon:yes gene_type:complete